MKPSITRIAGLIAESVDDPFSDVSDAYGLDAFRTGENISDREYSLDVAHSHYGEVDVYFTYEFVPEELQDHEYPGSPAHYDFIDFFLAGSGDILDLPREIQNVVVDNASERHLLGY